MRKTAPPASTFFPRGKKTVATKSDMASGLELLLNRSPMKGIPDPMERSRGLSDDLSKKMSALETALGKSSHTIVGELGKRSKSS